jgi:hypothetical protein
MKWWSLLPVVVVVHASRVLACATCLCGDPTLTVPGTERPVAGLVRVSSELRLRTSIDDGAALQEARATLGVAWAPTQKLVLSVDAPVWIARSRSFAGFTPSSAQGPGDVDAQARVVVFSDRAVAPHVLAGLRGGIRMPTGTALVKPGGALSVDLEPGTGAFTPHGGAWVSASRAPLSGFASIEVHQPAMDGHASIRGGTVVTAGALGQFQPLDLLAVRLGLDARAQQKDHVGALAIAGTDGVVTSVQAGVAVRPVDDVLVQLTVWVPIVQTARSEREGPMVSLGLALDVMP